MRLLMLGEEVQQSGETREPVLLRDRKAGNIASKMVSQSVDEIEQDRIILDLEEGVERRLERERLVAEDEDVDGHVCVVCIAWCLRFQWCIHLVNRRGCK